MPCNRTLRPDGVYVTRCSGELNLESLVAFFDEAARFAEEKADWFEVVVCESDCLVSVSYDEIQSLRVEVIKAFNGIERGAIAFVAESPSNYGVVRQFILSMDDGPIPMAPFSDYEEAHAWISARAGRGVSPQ